MGKRDHDDDDDNSNEVRLDKWLWAARFFKPRSLARTAIESGKVYVDGVRAKPSRTVVLGQQLRITNPAGEFLITVEGLSGYRGPASVAATLYSEAAESKHRREELRALHSAARAIAPAERPNTQDRRLLRRIKSGD
jgi:ribosome-associated heat shock protein Hsp15